MTVLVSSLIGEGIPASHVSDLTTWAFVIVMLGDKPPKTPTSSHQAKF